MRAHQILKLFIVATLIHCGFFEQPPDESCESCGENEIFSECSHQRCSNTCADPNLIMHCELEGGCSPGCVCLDGYLRDNEGKCIPKELCGCSDPNAEMVDCPNPCPGGTCLSPSFSPCRRACVRRGCQCKKGYVKDKNKKCIPLSACPDLCKDPNAEYSICRRCVGTCAKPTGYCPPVCDAGCACKQGYIRKSDVDDTCVKEKGCEKICPQNMTYLACGPITSRFCWDKDEDLNKPLECIKNFSGCYCKRGYVLNAKTKCVKIADCKCNGDPHSISALCGDACPLTCDNRNDPNRPTCQNICIPYGCKCKEGYLLNREKKCILPKDCPEICKKSNEEYNSCGTKCPATCANRNPVCTKQCVPGCFCKKGYIRNSNGDCIPVNMCPKQCKKPNEEYNSCGTKCPATCANKNPVCTKQCVPGCFCKKGYIRNSNGDCIPVNMCSPECKDPNAEYMECQRCVGTCEKFNVVCVAVCLPGCSCKEGFVRASFTDNTCVKYSDCPVLKCGVNEEYESCLTCSEDEDAFCVPGCKCMEGYIRNDVGNCKPENPCDD